MKKYAFIFFVLVFSRTAAAYTRITASSGQNPKWSSMPVSYWINEKGLSRISNGSDFAAVQASFRTWESIQTASIQFAYKGTTPVGTVGHDGLNVVTFTDTSVPLGSSTIAATFSFFKSENGQLLFDESDIAFNPSLDFSTSGELGKFDIQSVLTHEIGHLLGLDHAGMVSSVMVPFGSPSQLDQRTLAYDDIAGVMEIYPNPSTMPATGQIRGVIQADITPVFGAHVVAVDSSGTPVVSTLSQRDGGYILRFLPPGTYRVYSEPLDGPVTPQNIGGGTNGFYASIKTNFGTTYFGNVSTLAEATGVDVGPNIVSNADIQTLPASVTGLNLTRPAFGIRIPRGPAGTLNGIGGV
ncbi:MAG TPA: matrixin family metalloprotease, partial [Terriglobia bacterium]|nr:matrixin family metalloprotease [Terriglobia bacterium]